VRVPDDVRADDAALGAHPVDAPGEGGEGDVRPVERKW
jgi:hypothetical protein